MCDDDKAANAYKELMNQRQGYLTPRMAFIEGAKWQAAQEHVAELALNVRHSDCHKEITMFTQQEFDQALGEAQEEIISMAIATTKIAIKTERDACLHIVETNHRKEAIELIKQRGEVKKEVKEESKIILLN
jgi:hypothetical protein